MTVGVIFGLFIVMIFQQGVRGDVCDGFSQDSLLDAVHISATPKGGTEAGIYTKARGSSDLKSCIVSCCESDTCNVAFLYDDSCYLINCNGSYPGGCDPKERTGYKYENTYMVIARPPETNPSNEVDYDENYNSQTDDASNSYRIRCEPGNHDCRLDEVCQLTITEEFIGYGCVCSEGYRRDGVTCKKRVDRSCMYGLGGDQCLRHEECVPRNGRSRVGTCQCVNGYLQNTATGLCLPETKEDQKTPKPPSSKEDESSKSTTGASTTTTTSAMTTTSATTSATTTTTAAVEETPKASSLNKTASNNSSNPEAATEVLNTTISANSSALNESSTSSSKTTTSTTTSTTTTLPSVETLTVSAGGSKELQLPKNQLTLSAFAVPADDNGEYKYEWTLVQHPDGDGKDVGHMEDINTANLKLSQLVAGLYTFKVAVSAEGKYGETNVNVTVKPPARINKAPRAQVTPETQQVNQPNDVVLDGSQSSDDDKIVKYHWELVSGPLIDKTAQEANMDRPMLVLKGLSPGDYKFKLTVTDSDGATNSTFADVTVIKEVDYPPKANAGSNVIISLPQNSVTLYGNSSTDDKGIASYEWNKHEDKLTADMQGVRTASLHLENLQVGDYTFTLKVTDTAGQPSSADVHVFVKPEHNKPPVAKVGKDVTLFLPRDTVILNGTNSTDDQKISSYKWTQVSGGKPVPIENSDRALATVSKLSAGEYKFKLTVTDEEGLQTSATITVTVKENENHPPHANAGGDRVVTLPVSLVALDGTHSSDDRGITKYQWTRGDKSLAVGDILNGSDTQPVLLLTNLIQGRYFFTLEVFDDEGLSSSDTASIVVNPDYHANDLLELHLDADISSFTEANKNSVEDELALLIHKTNQEGETQVTIQRIYQGPNSNHLIATFYAITVTKEDRVIESGADVVETLKNKLRNNAGVIDYKILQLDTVVCQNNCSGHGHCDSTSKLCLCEAFWMENPLRFYLGDGESNCEWSVLYVIIISFISVIGFTGLVWGMACLCKRWFKYRPRKRHRYTLLDEDDDDDKHRVDMLPRGKMQNSSLMISESDFSSDEETIFINSKKTNGHVKNGLVKPPRNKVKS